MKYWRDVLSRDNQRAHVIWLNTVREGPSPLRDIEDTDLAGVRFSGGDLRFVTFRNCSFTDAGIEYSDVDNATFIDCWAETSSLSHARFYDVRIQACRFQRTDFRSDRFPGARISDSKLEHSAFGHGAFVDAVVSNTSFQGSGFPAAQIDRSRFANCDVRYASLGGVPIAGRSFDTHFENCDFRSADFTDRRFSGTTFLRCKFAGVNGRPVLEGPVTMVEPDFSEAGDGSDVRDPEVLLGMWTRLGST